MKYSNLFLIQTLALLVFISNFPFSFILDYPDYNSRIYSGYAEVKYEDGEEQKYRPQVRFPYFSDWQSILFFKKRMK